MNRKVLITLAVLGLLLTAASSVALAGMPLSRTEAPPAQSSDEDLEEFRRQLADYIGDLLELTQAVGASPSVVERLSETQQKIPEMTSDTLAVLRQVLPQDPDWWNAPQNTLASFGPQAQPLAAAAASQTASMRPIVPGVSPDCEGSVLEELIVLRATLRAAEIAREFTPGDFVFGVIVLGEGTVQTVSTHPARIIANIIVEGLNTAVTALEQVQAASDYCFGSNSQAIVHDFLEVMRVHLQVIEVQTLGCSQGFWKNRAEQWDSAIAGPADLAPNYDPSTLFDAVFGAGADTGAGLRDGATLLDVLGARGDGRISQARNAVTLLLNNDALNAGIDLPCSPTAVGDVGDFAPIVGPFMRRFLLSASEAGEPVDVSILAVHASALNPASLNFADVTATTTATMVKTGVLHVEVELSEAMKDARVFEFDVLHDHELKSIDDGAIFGRPPGVDIQHFGTILFHQEHKENLGMGQ